MTDETFLAEKKSPSRRFLFGGIALALTAPIAYGVLSGFSGRPSYAYPAGALKKFNERFNDRWLKRKDATYRQTSTQVAATAQAWLEKMKSRGIEIHPSINPALAVKIVGYESVMDTHAKSGSFEGLAQFARHSGNIMEPHALTVKQRVTGYINADPNIQAQIIQLAAAEKEKLVLKGGKKIEKAVEKKTVDESDITLGNVFLDPRIQTLCLMFEMHDSCEHLKQKPALFQLGLPHVHALLYLHHVLPGGASLIRSNFEQDVSLAELAKQKLSAEKAAKYPKYFIKNSGIFTSEGVATPKEVVHRVAVLLNESFSLFYEGPDKGDAKFKLSSLSGEARPARTTSLFSRLGLT